MNIQEAVKILDDATQPVNSGRISRSGYQLIETALSVVVETLIEVGKLERAPAPVVEPPPLSE